MNKLQLIADKIVNKATLSKRCEGWRLQGKRIVFTNGCYDILHYGHIVSIMKAAEEGNILVVGVNADTSVQKLKGRRRPVNIQEHRAMALAAMQFVDAVCIFEEDTPIDLIKIVKPAVLAKGGDYTIATIVGSDFVNSYGGKTVVLPMVEGLSTTAIIEKNKQS